MISYSARFQMVTVTVIIRLDMPVRRADSDGHGRVSSGTVPAARPGAARRRGINRPSHGRCFVRRKRPGSNPRRPVFGQRAVQVMEWSVRERRRRSHDCAGFGSAIEAGGSAIEAGGSAIEAGTAGAVGNGDWRCNRLGDPERREGLIPGS